ncbi:SH3 domain-containing protein, partial [bacterium]|nr:SH3 domain-containing protein [bacterium]
MKRRILWGGLLLTCVFALACQPSFDLYGTEPLVIITKSTHIKAIPEYSARDLGRLNVGAKVNLVNSVGEWYEIRYSGGRTGFVHSSVARVETEDSYILQEQLAVYHASKPKSRVWFYAAAGTQVFTLQEIQGNMIYIWIKKGRGGWVDQKEFAASKKEGHLPDKLEPSVITPAKSFGTWFVYEPFLITNQAGKTFSVLPGQNIRKNEVSQRGYEIILPNGWIGWTPSARVVSIYGKPVVTTIWTDCYGSLVGNSPVDFRYESGNALMIVGYENGYYNVNAPGKSEGHWKTRSFEKDFPIGYVPSIDLEPIKSGKKNLRTGYVRGLGLEPIKFQLAVVAKENAKMRFEPQTSSAEVASLHLGEEVICLEFRHEWWHVVTGGSNKDGWVKQESIAIPVWGYGVALQDVDINLKGPGFQYRSPLHKLERGDFVPLLQKWGDGYQVPVSEKEKLGWIETRDVVTASFRPLIVTAKEIRIREVQKGGKRGRLLPRGTELIELRQEGAYHLVTSFTWEVGYVLAEDVAVMHYGNIRVSETDTVRYGPGRQYQTRTNIVFPDKKVDISVLDYYDEWVQIDLGNNSGWIHK